MTTPQSAISVALRQTIGLALERSIARQPYADVIRHLGTMPAHHRKFLMSGERHGTLAPASSLFSEIHFSLDAPGTSPEARIVTMEFITVPGTFTLHHLAEVFGEWRRSPPEPQEAAYAMAWFVRHDVRSGSPFSLYAEYSPFGSAIDPLRTPDRVFFQPEDGRWD